MARRYRIGQTGQAAIAVLFAGLGCLGIWRSLAPTALRVQDEQICEPIVLHVHERVTRLRQRLAEAPDDPCLHLRLGRAYAWRAVVLAHQEYSATFPGSLQDDRFPVLHYGEWCRGWFLQDRNGDLRRAIQHGHRALSADPPVPLRRAALEFLSYVYLRRGRRSHSGAGPARPARELREVTACVPGRFTRT